MESRVKEILSWYSSDSPGTRTNIARLLNHGRLAGTGGGAGEHHCANSELQQHQPVRVGGVQQQLHA